MGILKFRADGNGQKCPLFTDHSFVGDCIKENCTFWLPEAGQCSIPVLARQALGLKQ